MDPAEYCREIETYLCRKNEGHLVRIVGPAFEQVCGWANLGVPLKVAFRGIDQYCDRYYAKGSRRRPVRIEFCEADILDLFDAWRRAIGVSQATQNSAADDGPSKRPSLAKHLARAVARLTPLRAGGGRSPAFGERIDAVIRRLDVLAGETRSVRGDARAAVVEELRSLDQKLMDAVRAEAPTELIAALQTEADGELTPFRARMPHQEFERAHAAAVDRLLRDAFGLPVLAYD